MAEILLKVELNNITLPLIIIIINITFSLHATPSNSFPPGATTAPIYYDDVRCTGSETNILNCNMTAVGDNDCDHSEDIGVFCSGNDFF